MKIENPDHKVPSKNRIRFFIALGVMVLLVWLFVPRQKHPPQLTHQYVYEIINGDTAEIDVTGLDSAQLDSLFYARHPLYQPDSAAEAALQAWQDSVFNMEDSPIVDSLLKKWNQ